MIIYDPTRTFSIKPTVIEVEPQKKPKWYQKAWWRFRRFLDSGFVFYTMILLVRIVQVSLIVLAFYFLQGGRLW